MNTYRTGQAAKLLGVSPHNVRKLCEAGILEGELTEGNRWRIPAAEIDRLKSEGIPPIPQLMEDPPPAVRSGGLVSRNRPRTHQPELDAESESVETESPEVRAEADAVRKAAHRLQRRKLELEQEDVEDLFKAREQRAAKEEAGALEKRKEQLIAETEKAITDSWLKHALTLIPVGYPPECRVPVVTVVGKVLADFTKAGARSAAVIRDGVEGATHQALLPFRRRKNLQAALENALGILPYNARSFETPTKWELKAREAANFALNHLSADSEYVEMVAVAKQAVRLITDEFESEQRKLKLLENMRWWMLGEASKEERDEATAAVVRMLAKQPIEMTERELRVLKESVLAPFEKAVDRRSKDETRRRREEATLQQRQIQADHVVTSSLLHIGTYLLNNYEFENHSERYEAVRQLTEDMRPIIAKRLMNGLLDTADVRSYIEEWIDDWMADDEEDEEDEDED